MDGYQQKPRLHSREKKVASGTAEVRKGQKTAKAPARDNAVKLPSVEQIRSEPKQNRAQPAPKTQRSKPLKIDFNDSDDAARYHQNVTVPYQQYAAERDATPPNNMSLDELKRRMDELEQALTSAYDRQNADRMRYRTAEGYANGNWDVAEAKEDAGWALGADEATQQQLFMDYIQAAAVGKSLEKQKRYDIAVDEGRISSLYWEYNNLKNEYNMRLAQYLQGMR